MLPWAVLVGVVTLILMEGPFSVSSQPISFLRQRKPGCMHDLQKPTRVLFCSLCAVLDQSSFAQPLSTALFWGLAGTASGINTAVSWGLCQRLNCIISWFSWRPTYESTDHSCSACLPCACFFLFQTRADVLQSVCYGIPVQPLTCLVKKACLD